MKKESKQRIKQFLFWGGIGCGIALALWQYTQMLSEMGIF
jgi:hypothetical protein